MAGLLLMLDSLALQTRSKSDIENSISRQAPPDGVKLQIEAYKQQYPRAIHRDVGPCATYNCHGLTFASRRTGVSKPSVIQTILSEDEYQRVPVGSVLEGDIAVYFSAEGDPEHSGIVMKRSPQGPHILSKWGMCHEVIHLFNECPYIAMDVRYFRVRS